MKKDIPYLVPNPVSSKWVSPLHTVTGIEWGGAVGTRGGAGWGRAGRVDGVRFPLRRRGKLGTGPSGPFGI